MRPAATGQNARMERSGTTPQVSVDTSDLADLVKASGPFLTVLLTTEPDIDNAAQRATSRAGGLEPCST